MAIKTYQSLGDVLDRITILVIKAFYVDGAYELKNVMRELAKVLPSLDDLDDEQWIRLQDTFLELRDINHDLWEMEYRIRSDISDGEDPKEIVETISAIHTANMARADSKRWITDQLDPGFGEIKDYDIPYKDLESD